MSDPVLFAAYVVAIVVMFFAMVDTMLRRRAAERNIAALTDRLRKQRKRIAKLSDRAFAADNRDGACNRNNEAVEAVWLLLPIVQSEYDALYDIDRDNYTDWKTAIDAGDAVLAADKRWHEHHAETIERLIKANEGRK